MGVYVLWCGAGIYFLASKTPRMSTAVGLGVIRWMACSSELLSFSVFI